jgi:hypothetical protein
MKSHIKNFYFILFLFQYCSQEREYTQNISKKDSMNESKYKKLITPLKYVSWVFGSIFLVLLAKASYQVWLEDHQEQPILKEEDPLKQSFKEDDSKEFSLKNHWLKTRWLQWSDECIKYIEKEYQDINKKIDENINVLIKESKLIKAQENLKNFHKLSDKWFLKMMESLNQNFEDKKKLLDEYIDKTFLKKMELLSQNLNRTFENKKKELEKNQKIYKSYQDKGHLQEVEKRLLDESTKRKDKILFYQDLIKKRALELLKLDENNHGYTFEEIKRAYDKEIKIYDEKLEDNKKTMETMKYDKFLFETCIKNLRSFQEEKNKVEGAYLIFANDPSYKRN